MYSKTIPVHNLTVYNYNIPAVEMDLVRLVGYYTAAMNTFPLTDKTSFRLSGIQTHQLDLAIRRTFDNKIRKNAYFKEFSFRLTIEAGFTSCILVTITRKPRKPVVRYFQSNWCIQA